MSDLDEAIKDQDEDVVADIAKAHRTEMHDMRMKYLGCLGLLAECHLHLSESMESQETRECIRMALDDAKEAGLIKWRRILNRIEIDPA